MSAWSTFPDAFILLYPLEQPPPGAAGGRKPKGQPLRTPSTGAGGPARSTFANALLLLAERPFLVVWSVGALTGLARWLELLAVGLYVFDRTGSPLLVTADPGSDQ